MAMTMLMYASVSRVPATTAADIVDGIVTLARIRNSSHDITGALVYTGQHFVQIIEGPTAAIAALWTDLQADPRHEGLVLAKYGPLAERRFDGWSLAYSGPAHYVQSRVQLLFSAADPKRRDRAARRLAELMYLFSFNHQDADKTLPAPMPNAIEDDSLSG